MKVFRFLRLLGLHPAPPKPAWDTPVSIPKKWRCFHCDEVFHDPRSAADHFGFTEHDLPGCVLAKVEERGLLGALRRAQVELASFYREDSELDRAFASLQSDSVRKITEAEQKGYDKGLRDSDNREIHPPSLAIKDGRTLRLLVRFTDNHLIDTAEPHWTIGHNSFDHTGVDEWQFAGWSWCQDVYTQGHGEVLGWKEF